MSSENSPPRWDNEETRRLVHSVYGSSQLMLLRPALRAVNYRMAHAEYHYREYQRITQAHIDSKLHAGSDIWEVTSPTSDEEANSMATFYVECEAHLYAFVQAVHAAADNLAHVVYYVLGLNLGAGIKGRVSLDSIEKHVGQMAQTTPTLVSIANLLSGLKSASTFVELGDLVNHLKHHGGPSVCVLHQPSADKAYEIQFGGFLRDSQHRRAISASQFLADSHQVLNVAIVNVGIALGTWLESAVSQKALTWGFAKSPDEPAEAVAPTRSPQST